MDKAFHMLSFGVCSLNIKTRATYSLPIGCGIFLREKGSGGGSLTRLIGPSRDKALKGRWPDAGTSVREDDDLRSAKMDLCDNVCK